MYTDDSNVITVMTVITGYIFFFFNDTATTEIYTLSLHDALPISSCDSGYAFADLHNAMERCRVDFGVEIDRKSTRLNSSHSQISYAVFCLKKKKNQLHQLIGLTILDLIMLAK